MKDIGYSLISPVKRIERKREADDCEGLKNIRQFYKVYFEDQIGETVFSQFENLPSTDTGRKSNDRYFIVQKKE